jgi:DNA-binding response OmpR family regulator
MYLLLVDDDQEFTSLLKMELEDQGYQLDVAFNGFDGSSLALKNPYDVIILDLMLPGMNGLHICRKLRKHRVQVPVLMISSLDSREEENAGISAGADAFLGKPFRFEELQHKIIMLDRKHKNN